MTYFTLSWVLELQCVLDTLSAPQLGLPHSKGSMATSGWWLLCHTAPLQANFIARI